MATHDYPMMRPARELAPQHKNRAVELLLEIMLKHGDAPFAISYTDHVIFGDNAAQFDVLDMLHSVGLLRSYHDVQKDKLYFKITEKGLDLCR